MCWFSSRLYQNIGDWFYFRIESSDIFCVIQCYVPYQLSSCLAMCWFSCRLYQNIGDYFYFRIESSDVFRMLQYDVPY